MNKEDGDEDESQSNEFNKGKKKMPQGSGQAEKDQVHYYSKNYKRFLNQRANKVDKFINSCIGWSHVLRVIEVIDMAMRDLIYKIVPTKVVVRELKTSTNKILTKDSEYVLKEHKKYVSVGKKTQIDYVFELDLKEDAATLNKEQQAELEKEQARK
jgi:hypothetical protein